MKEQSNVKRVKGGTHYIETIIIPMVNELRRSPTRSAFEKLSQSAVDKWKKDGENTFADYFTTFYLCPKWTSWYVGSQPLPGLGLTNNPQESANRQIKRIVKAKFDTFLSVHFYH